ncbi:MAG: hypothetical protein OCD00_15770 [Colwellia sp.]
MAETINTAEAAVQISNEIFTTFKWSISELHDQNMDCAIKEHDKKTHPCDCVFYYIDPYLGKVIYLNTDLKSYGKDSIQKQSVKIALKSLSLATHCANVSDSWNDNYLLPHDGLDYQVRGFLFVYNHDKNYSKDFHEQLSAINPSTLPIAKKQMLHIFGPKQIEDCYAIASDLNILIGQKKVKNYSFWYPDMMLHKVRHGDVWDQPATIEMLSSPLIIVKYQTETEEGYVIYYKRDGEKEDEFIYLIDMLSHYQLLSEGLKIDLRFISKDRSTNIKTNFRNAKLKYMQTWSMDEGREKQLNLITPTIVNRMTSHYNIGELGWKE